jgi:hypothetical protein
MEWIQFFGVILIVGVLVFGGWCAVTRSPAAKGSHVSFKAIAGLVLIGCFLGFACLLADRITGFSIRGIGSLQAVTAQAMTDAAQVADLRQRVENQSATVDLVASQATKANTLSGTVASQVKEAEQKLKVLNKTIEDAKSTVDNLRQEGDFTLIVLKAENDDRKSFDELWKLSQDPSYRFTDMARAVWTTVLDAHANPIFETFAPITWADGVDPKKLSLNDLAQLFYSGNAYKPMVLQYISTHYCPVN